ncbi:MAG: L,D-transpeptidase family protein [Syntrophomonadaceae bacterium]|nr:L,D-transpeptidase family protein [Syntrophomonadaceae bacterium]
MKKSFAAGLLLLWALFGSGAAMAAEDWYCPLPQNQVAEVAEDVKGHIPRAERVWIEIDVALHTLVLYQGDTELKRYDVAVGKSSTPTPLGEWKVVNKGVDWGSGFGTRWLGLNVPWGIYGIHGTNRPGSIGSSASHGCIRMHNSSVEELYPLVPYGTMVRIVENGRLFPDDFRPRELSKGDSGQSVVYLQSRLKELGIVLDNADGRFGNMTELALRYYQAWHGLEADGVADEEVYRALGMIE